MTLATAAIETRRRRRKGLLTAAVGAAATALIWQVTRREALNDPGYGGPSERTYVGLHTPDSDAPTLD